VPYLFYNKSLHGDALYASSLLGIGLGGACLMAITWCLCGDTEGEDLLDEDCFEDDSKNTTNLNSSVSELVTINSSPCATLSAHPSFYSAEQCCLTPSCSTTSSPVCVNIAKEPSEENQLPEAASQATLEHKALLAHS